MSTAHRTNAEDARGRKYVIGYLAAALLMLVLWVGVYAWAVEGASVGGFAAGHCPEIADQATRLACYDNTNQASQRQPGRGYAPVVR